MPIKSYDTVNGQLIGETTSGVRTEYLTDALGSVTATLNSSGEIVNTYRYKPYGQLLSKTGSGEDPRYLWTGNTGSRRTLVTYAEQYNQARHYGSKQAGWTTVDPTWPNEPPFAYITNPVLHIDPTGHSVYVDECTCEKCMGSIPKAVPPPYPITPAVRTICDNMLRCSRKKGCMDKLASCIKDCGYGDGNGMAKCLSRSCNGNKTIVVSCSPDDPGCLTSGVCAYTVPFSSPCRVNICAVTTRKRCLCGPWSDRCTVPSCAAENVALELTIAHEMSHCCGLGIDGWFGNQGVGDCIAGCVVDDIRRWY